MAFAGAEEFRNEIINAAVDRFQDVFMKSGFLEKADQIQKQLEAQAQEKSTTVAAPKPEPKKQTQKGEKSLNKNKTNPIAELNRIMSQASTLELTIYKNAVENKISKRASTSSEEEFNSPLVETSDELEISDESNKIGIDNGTLIENFITDVREYDR